MKDGQSLVKLLFSVLFGYDICNLIAILGSCDQAIVLEGSYWKRRIEVVIKEYHKWRIYHKKRVSFTPHKALAKNGQFFIILSLLCKVAQVF